MEIDYSSYGQGKVWVYYTDNEVIKAKLESNDIYYAYFPILVSSKEKYLISIY